MGNLRQHRILGGVKVYNIKGLLKIKFYEKMVHYYQKSIQIKDKLTLSVPVRALLSGSRGPST